MADPKADHRQITKRCGERVKMARLTSPLHPFGNQVLVAGQGTGPNVGAKVEAMALHPSGLAVIPLAGAFRGEKIVIPGAQVEFVLLADEET